jgi:hypothetical protein
MGIAGQRRRQRMASFDLLTSLLTLATITATWAASQDDPAFHYLLEPLSSADWTALTPLLVVVLALAAANKPVALRLVVSAFRLVRRALVYLAQRAGSMIIDRLLEMVIVALIAIMAGVSWLTDFTAVLGRMFH